METNKLAPIAMMSTAQITGLQERAQACVKDGVSEATFAIPAWQLLVLTSRALTPALDEMSVFEVRIALWDLPHTYRTFLAADDVHDAIRRGTVRFREWIRQRCQQPDFPTRDQKFVVVGAMLVIDARATTTFVEVTL